MADRTPLRFDSPLPRWLASLPPAAWCAALYGAAAESRSSRFDRQPHLLEKINAPVISIGGIRAGGTGKTPAVMLIAEILKNLGCTVAVLSRGYKRSGSGPQRIAPDENVRWELIGDEPAMIRGRIPGIWLGIGADRFGNARILRDKIGDSAVFLLDDGFQHRRLHRDLDIVCIHESILSDRLIPQGFLREPLQSLSRAHVFFLIASEDRVDRIKEVGKKLADIFPAAGQFLLVHQVIGWVNFHTGAQTTSLPCEHPLALCGIARPERFFSMVDSMGIKPCRTVTFPDHFHYAEYHIRPLRELYSQGLITTEKDAVRLRGLSNIPEERSWYLKIQLKFAENESLHRFHHYIRSIDFPLLKGGLGS